MLVYPLNAPSTPLVSIFKFTANNSIPYRPLSFARPNQGNKSSSTITSKRKRTRPLADLDDSHAGSKKKRRLRLLLITSRLSRPFSTPATHIVDRGSSKIAVWAKKKSSLGQQVLRKAAIMNFARCRIREKEACSRKDSGVSVGEDERAEVRRRASLGVETDVLGEIEVKRWQGPNNLAVHTTWPKTTGRCAERIVQPSPLGLSNYDALDEEDEIDFGYFDDEDKDEETGYEYGDATTSRKDKRKKGEDEEYYTDWNCFDNVQETRIEEEDEYADPFSLSVLSKGLVKEKRPPSPPEGKRAEILKESEREKEVLMMGFNGFGTSL
ncbi:hypothetical protein BLS_002248 [Venturia inaequalis]|uniref:Uncharacterized protein n=1 Tax=Venturia inaequalis TaxID=5025 RepID=A0A8H3YL09_VENIN|nr:hypothetical protein EG328_011252 [Venturia inaequalis]KAE9976106.1 hypothetical protein BLS_002248 [Venturia inaequalis]KAE9994537.1 hypothetical protein EG327_008050 [Venturia inaequalis]RDI87833.1 hypothetical protein Vi05172_g1687 [Venturia inaequalis]